MSSFLNFCNFSISGIQICETLTPPTEKKKILCLHGGEESATSFKNQAGMIDLRTQLEDSFDFHFIDAPNSIGVNQFIWIDEQKEGETQADPQLAINSINTLDKYILDNGPFYAILGYSQGASMALVYVSTNRNIGSMEYSKRRIFSKVILFNGYFPILNNNLVNDMNKVSKLPFSNLIFAAENDDNFYQLSLDLVEYFQQPNLVVSSTADHALPTNNDSTFNTVVEYLNSPEKEHIEFTTSQNITLKWSYEVGLPGSWFNNEKQGYDKNHIFIDEEDNSLNIIMKKEGNNYYSSRVVTKDKNDFLKISKNQVLSIIFEAKLPKTYDNSGNIISNVPVWPAFWMLGQEFWENDISWPSCSEIDIMEWTPVKNNGNYYSTAIHWNRANNFYYSHKFLTNSYFTDLDLLDSFNNYEVKIYKYNNSSIGKIEMYFNDILVKEYKSLEITPNGEELFNTSLNIDNSEFNLEEKYFGLLSNIALSGNYTSNSDIPNNFDYSKLIIKDIRFNKENIDDN